MCFHIVKFQKFDKNDSKFLFNFCENEKIFQNVSEFGMCKVEI